jgi:hypothetical protein
MLKLVGKYPDSYNEETGFYLLDDHYIDDSQALAYLMSECSFTEKEAKEYLNLLFEAD